MKETIEDILINMDLDVANFYKKFPKDDKNCYIYFRSQILPDNSSQLMLSLSGAPDITSNELAKMMNGYPQAKDIIFAAVGVHIRNLNDKKVKRLLQKVIKRFQKLNSLEPIQLPQLRIV